MNLAQLTNFKHIAIQCHDNPDADSIAAGYGLYCYFTVKGHSAILFYSGKNRILKPNLLKMIQLLQIPLEHYPQPESWPGLLITADCQFGAGNVAPMTAESVAVIDHHIQECSPPALHDIRPYLGSCSTLVWTLLSEAEFCINTFLATALHYGLFTDTNGLSEVRHPLDRDLRDSLEVDNNILKILKNSNLSLNDLSLASAALKDLSFDPAGRFALVGVQPCDPNILGFVSDLAMQVDMVDTVLAYSEVVGGIKYSVRRVSSDAKASDIAAWIASKGLGSGGGHAEKAGGYISAKNFADHCPGMTASEFFKQRLSAYIKAYTVIDCSKNVGGDSTIETALAQVGAGSAWGVFEKLPVRLSYVPCAEAFAENTTLHIRMLEGDISVTIDADTMLMIGIQGEMYPISQKKFESTYTREYGTPDIQDTTSMPLHYAPAVLDRDKGSRILLSELSHPCIGKGGGRVNAFPLTSGLKLFTRWDADNYIKGECGDWLVQAENDPSDMYIVTPAIFPLLYKALSVPTAMRVDLSNLDIASVPGRCHVRKKPLCVQVSFACGAGVVQTREGTVSYTAGDALITGTAGEVWPVSPEYFQKNYRPAGSREYGKDGPYTTLPVSAWALQIHMPFMVKLKNGSALYGKQGDRLMQYSSGEYGIVGVDFFNTIYEYVKPAS